MRPTLAASLVENLFRKAEAERWGLSIEDFGELVEASVRHGLSSDEPTSRELNRYLEGLHLADLALAGACARGSDAAWEHFMLEQRPVLYRAADALDPAGGARELADSLYAELYGVRGATGERRSLFRYFHGRSSLTTWLRAVLAQRYVDRFRAQRRVDPLPSDDGAAPAARPRDTDPDRATLVPLVEQVLEAAIGALPAKDRLRLRSYYASQMTLAEIGRITGEHEATVSRQLSRTRRTLRSEVERLLSGQARLTPAQIARAFELAVEDPGGFDLQQVFDPGSHRKESPQDRSRYEDHE